MRRQSEVSPAGALAATALWFVNQVSINSGVALRLSLHALAMSSILYDRRDQLAIICLNRPEKFNTLSLEMILALSDTFTNMDSQPNPRAVILTGAGDKAFCAGIDIGDPAAVTAPNSEREVAERAQTLCSQIESCGVPVIAAVNGIAAGSGCELALACHLRIAAADAQFSLPETGLGTIAASGRTQRLAREIGEGSALEMLLLSRAVSAEEALQFGLINRVAPAAELLAQAEVLAQEIARLAPLAIRACLEAVTQGNQLPLVEGLELEARLFAGLFSTDDVREGTSAFLAKRAPVFKGK